MPLFNWEKTLFICRGLPGSGKSTLALELVGGNKEQVVENDNYWIIDNSYIYAPEMTHLAGNWCAAEAFRRLRIFDKVAVANTFIQRKYILEYVEECRKLGINVELHEPNTPWKNDVSKCFQTNIHVVPLEVIERMAKQWEPITQAEIDIMLNKPTTPSASWLTDVWG
jgi:predicted kinase